MIILRVLLDGLQKIVKGLTLMAYLFMMSVAVYYRAWTLYGILDLTLLGLILGLLWFHGVHRPCWFQRKVLRIPEKLIRYFLAGLPFLAIFWLSQHPMELGFVGWWGNLVIYVLGLGYGWTTASYFPWLILLLGACVVMKFSRWFPRGWPWWILIAIGFFYGIDFYSGQSYNPTHVDQQLPHHQPFLKVYPFSQVYSRGRQLVIDSKEEFFYASFFNSFDYHSSKNGILQYQIETHQEKTFHSTAVGNRFLFNEASQTIYFSNYRNQAKLLQLSLENFSVSPVTRSSSESPIYFPDYADAIDWLTQDVLVLRHEHIGGKNSGLIFIDFKKKESNHRFERDLILEIPLLVGLNVSSVTIPGREEGFSLISGNNKTYLVRFRLDRTVEILQEWMGYAVEVYYSPFYQTLFIPFLDRNLLLEVSLDGLKTKAHLIPKGVRELIDGPQGTLVLLSYLDHTLSLYHPRKHRLLRTINAPSYTESMAIGPHSGNLYIATSNALWVYDLHQILSSSHSP